MDDDIPATREESLTRIQEHLPGKTVSQIDYQALTDADGDLIITFEDGWVLTVTGDHLNWGSREPGQE